MNPIAPLPPVHLSSATSAAPASGAQGSGGFGSILDGAINQLAASQASANQAVAQAMTGSGSVTQMMVALTAAQMTLDVSVGVRNAVVSAYQSVINMPLD